MARILLVEDDESVRVFTARALGADGHEVATADDGDSGLSMICETKGDFDLVLSDIRMPVLDGIEMAKQAVGVYPELKILLMTGYAEQRERAGDLADIIINVVSKPFTLSDIRHAVSTALAA